MAANDIVRTFKQGKVDITVYETATGAFVAADQAGWIDDVWATADEAMAGALRVNGLSAGVGK